MSRISRRIFFSFSKENTRRLSRVTSDGELQAKYVEDFKHWPVRVAVLLTRFPVITSDVNELQETYERMCVQAEIEKSVLSDHEIAIESQKSGDSKNIVTAKDFELSQQQKLSVFQPAARMTAEENDPKSLNKKLSRKLFLAVKDPELSKKQYTLPSTILQEGESLRIAAERCLIQSCGTSIRAQFWSNAPNALFHLNLPKSARPQYNNSKGLNYFVFMVNYISNFESSYEDFAWIGKDDLRSYFVNRKFRSLLNDLIFEF